MNVKTQSYSVVYKNNNLLSTFCVYAIEMKTFFFLYNFICEYAIINGNISSSSSRADDEFGNNGNTLKPLYTIVVLWRWIIDKLQLSKLVVLRSQHGKQHEIQL